MLFNSYEYIFAFLPVTVIGFHLLGIASRALALHWIIFASCFFYAWWRPINVFLMAPSITINFMLARTLLQLGRDGTRGRASNAVLLLGIAFNITFLGYFKYTGFVAESMNDIFGTQLVLTHVILPLGISFITFQKIAFLIDVHAGRITAFTIRDYCLFVLFFPQLVAGPIVHYREMMPQFHGTSCRFDKDNVAVGTTLFFFGLFKKAFLADSIAPHVTSIYDRAATGDNISLLVAWMAAIGFTLQIYFDFSGYSDMALGAARLFGIRLPPNFNSPLRASSIIDFWLRWHMTLTRFLTAYIYNPLALSLTRWRMERGRAGLGGPNTTVGAFVELLMLPTVLTMLVSGIWHGAGYLFVLWGLLHGLYLTMNHAWRLAGVRWWRNRGTYTRVMKPIGLVLTSIAVIAGMVVFRSTTVVAAMNVLKGMIGLNGVSLPRSLFDRLGWLGGSLNGVGVTTELTSASDFSLLAVWIIIMGTIAWACPNTLQILAPYEPALGIKRRLSDRQTPTRIEWNPSIAWAIGVSVIAAIGVTCLGGQSEFLYWQF